MKNNDTFIVFILIVFLIYVKYNFNPNREHVRQVYYFFPLDLIIISFNFINIQWCFFFIIENV